MMRRSKTSGIAGNCSCCLVPALILLAIIVAAVIGVAVVWQSAVPSVFRWDYGDHHHYNAYRDGYKDFGEHLAWLTKQPLESTNPLVSMAHSIRFMW